MSANVSMISTGSGVGAPMFRGNPAVGGTTPMQPQNPRQQNAPNTSALEMMQMLKLIEDMRARRKAGGTTGGGMGKGGGAGVSNYPTGGDASASY